MLIKLGIITGIIVLGGMIIFSTEINNSFPTMKTTVDSLKNNITSFGSKATNSAEQRIDKSINNVVDKAGNSITNEISKSGDKVTDELYGIKETSQKIIDEKISHSNPIESLKNIFSINQNLKNSNP